MSEELRRIDAELEQKRRELLELNMELSRVRFERDCARDHLEALRREIEKWPSTDTVAAILR